MDLDVINYEAFIQEEQNAIDTLKKALFEKGIVGIRGIPTYREKVARYIEAFIKFQNLPEEVKEQYAPDRDAGDLFLGYEKGKEKFKLPDGRWAVDDLKVSFYTHIPDHAHNKWPKEINLRDPYLAIGLIMAEIGKAVMKTVELIGPKTGIDLDNTFQTGRMLYYKSSEVPSENPYWYGEHFDHALFTALLPATYFENGLQIPEPQDAGLFVKSCSDGIYRKVLADDPDVLLFQVGEFGQLALNDQIKAIKHRVQKSSGSIERYTAALYFGAPYETVIHSTSILTEDSRYSGGHGLPCSYEEWERASFARYIV